MAKTTKSKRRYDSHDTRERILDAAMDAFQRAGYHATSNKDLLEAADVPAGSMYHLFPTKKGLALGVIRERVMPAVRDTWIEPMRHAVTPEAGIVAVFEATAGDLDRSRTVLGCPVTNLAAELATIDPEYRVALDEAYAAWAQSVERRLAESSNRDTRERATILANLVVSSFAGAMTLAKSANDSRPLRECVAALKLLLSYQPPPESPPPPPKSPPPPSPKPPPDEP